MQSFVELVNGSSFSRSLNAASSFALKDVECTDENINKILNGKDLSNGILVFINGGQNNDEMMEKIKNATGLNEWKWIKGLNACNIYLVK